MNQNLQGIWIEVWCLISFLGDTLCSSKRIYGIVNALKTKKVCSHLSISNINCSLKSRNQKFTLPHENITLNFQRKCDCGLWKKKKPPKSCCRTKDKDIRLSHKALGNSSPALWSPLGSDILMSLLLTGPAGQRKETLRHSRSLGKSCHFSNDFYFFLLCTFSFKY